VKKISVDDHPLTTGDYGSDYSKDSHWWVRKWEVGTTEKGSSGGPIFNQNHEVVGTLTGGQANCDNSVNDYYSKVSRAWDDYVSSHRQLKAWLDPLELGISHLNGFDPQVPRFEYDARMYEILEPSAQLCNVQTVKPTLVIQNKGLKTVDSLLVGYTFNNIDTVSMWHVDSIPSNRLDTVVFPEIEVTEGTLSFHAFVKLPSGLLDEDLMNNNDFIMGDAKYGSAVSLDLTTDDWGSETTWEITNADHLTVASGGPYPTQASIDYHYDFCLSDGCYYTFVINDEDGDGICCLNGDGHFKLANITDGVTIAEGAKFLEKLEFDFCTTSHYWTMDSLISDFLLYPNPVRGDKLWVKGDHRAITKLEVMDVTGRILDSSTAFSKDLQIDFSHRQNGVYFLYIYEGDKKKAYTIVVNH